MLLLSSLPFPLILVRPAACHSPPPVNTPNKKPQGFQVAPFLIAVSPVGAGIQAQGFAVQPTDIAIGDVGAGFSAQANFFGPTKYAWNPILGADITPPDKRGRPPAWAKDLPPKTGAAAAAAKAVAERARASASASSNAAGAASSSSSPSGSGGGSSDSSSSIVGDVDPSAGLLRRRRRSLFLADSSEGTVRGSDAGSFDGGSTGDDGADDGAGAGGLQRQLKRRILLSVTSSNDGEGSSDKLGGRGDNSNNVHAGDGSASEAAAGTTTTSGQKKLILNLDDPLDLSSDFPSDYRNWAAVLSQVLLKKEGFGNERKRKSVDDHGDVLSRGSSSGGDKFGAALAPDARRAAVAALERVMLATHGHLAKAASGEEFFPRFHLRDPVFEAERGPSATEAAAVGLPPPQSAFLLPSFVDGGAAAASNNTTTTAPRKKKIANTRLSADATFFNFSPCVISESATGSAASLTGLNFAPSLITFAATVLSAQVTGEICFSKSCFFPAQPSSHLFFHLLYVEQIMEKNVAGINWAPQLIFVNNVGAQAVPQGATFFSFLIFPPPVERDKARRFLVILTRERPPLSKVALKEGFEQVSAGMQRRRQRRRQGCLPRLQRCEAAPARRSSSTSAFSPVRMERRRGPQRGLPGAPQFHQERRAPDWARPSRRGAWRSRRGAQRARRGFASSDGCRTGLANPSPTICFSSSSKPKKMTEKYSLQPQPRAHLHRPHRL